MQVEQNFWNRNSVLLQLRLRPFGQRTALESVHHGARHSSVWHEVVEREREMATGARAAAAIHVRVYKAATTTSHNAVGAASYELQRVCQWQQPRDELTAQSRDDATGREAVVQQDAADGRVCA